MREKTNYRRLCQDDNCEHDELHEWGETRIRQLIAERSLGLITRDEFREKSAQFIEEYGKAAIESLRPKV